MHAPYHPAIKKKMARAVCVVWYVVPCFRFIVCNRGNEIGMCVCVCVSTVLVRNTIDSGQPIFTRVGEGVGGYYSTRGTATLFLGWPAPSTTLRTRSPRLHSTYPPPPPCAPTDAPPVADTYACPRRTGQYGTGSIARPTYSKVR